MRETINRILIVAILVALAVKVVYPIVRDGEVRNFQVFGKTVWENKK